jgi:hypothetical protein
MQEPTVRICVSVAYEVNMETRTCDVRAMWHVPRMQKTKECILIFNQKIWIGRAMKFAFFMDLKPLKLKVSLSKRRRPFVYRTRASSQKVAMKCVFFGRVQLKCDGTRWNTGGEVKGKLTNGVGSQYSSHYLATWCIQHYYLWCAHFSCQ